MRRMNSVTAARVTPSKDLRMEDSSQTTPAKAAGSNLLCLLIVGDGHRRDDLPCPGDGGVVAELSASVATWNPTARGVRKQDRFTGALDYLVGPRQRQRGFAHPAVREDRPASLPDSPLD